MAGYLEIADGQVGYQGHPDNYTKYWAELEPSLQGQPWCACFVSWCLKHAGVLESAIGGKMYSCTAMMNRAKSRGQWASNPRVGALAIFDFGSGSPAHVEFVVTAGGSTNVHIGGNTSNDLVAKKTRQHSDILGYWHLDVAAGSIPAGTGDSGPMAITGNGTLVAAAAQTITGAAEGDPAVAYGHGRFVSY